MSKIDYDALAVDGLKSILIQIAETCKALDIEFFIVGAIARNIWYVANDENPAGTKDVDFGIYVSKEEDYQNLRKTLIKQFEYSDNVENAFCLVSKEGKQIDLLPFGEIEKEGQMLIEGKALISVNLDGFKEAYLFGTIEAEIGDETYKVCSIPGMVILKLIAYDDRPEVRVKDVKDINSICMHYPNIESELIWEEHFDLYDAGREHHEIGLVVLGREMKKLTSENKALHLRILSIINRSINEETKFLSLMIDDNEKETLEGKGEILKCIREGFM